MSPADPQHSDPVSSLSQGEDPLAIVLTSLEEGLKEAVDGFTGILEDTVERPLRNAFSEAAQNHRRAVTHALRAAELAGEGDTDGATISEDADPRSCLSEYRNAVLTQVLEPLRDALLSFNAGQGLEASWTSFQAELVRLVAALPDEVRRPEPKELYLPREEDSLPIRIGKALARIRCWIRTTVWKGRQGIRSLAGREALAQPIRIQKIPMESLVGRCFRGTLSLGLESCREGLHQHYAGILSSLESAIAQWTRDWPILEVEVEKELGCLFNELPKDLAQRISRISALNPDGSSEEEPRQPKGETPPEFITRIEEVTAGLESGLSAGEGLSSPLDVLERLEGFIREERAGVLKYAGASGSFMRSSPRVRWEKAAEKRKRKQETRSESWVIWHRSVPSRLLLAIHLLRIRKQISECRERLIRGVAEAAVIPMVENWEASSGAFRTLVERGEEAFLKADSAEDLSVLSSEVHDLLHEGLGVLEEKWIEPLGSGAIELSVHELADDVTKRLASFLLKLPDAISVQATQKGQVGRLDPTTEVREIRIRELTRQVLDVMRLEGVRNTPEPVLGVLANARAEVNELPEVLRFNLDAAQEELGGISSEPSPSVMEAAHSLTSEALVRTEEGIGRLLFELPEGWERFKEDAAGLLDDAFRDVHGRISTEGRVQEQIIGGRERFKHWSRRGLKEARAFTKRATRTTRRTGRKWTVRGLRAIRMGRVVVGAAAVEKGEGERALAVINQAPKLLLDLPLIYRRLFSFEPLEDESLLKGRSEEKGWVQTQFQNWKAGLGGATVLTGPVGAGHTSFFNVLSSSLFSDTHLFRLELRERIRSGEVLAGLIGGSMGLSEEDCRDLPDLARKIREVTSRGRQRVVLTERLEHLFLRTPGGMDLFEDFLSLQARTSDSVFWLSSMSGAAWKLAATAEPRAATLFQAHPLTPPTRQELEELVLARHRRSGLPLEFRAPADLNPLVRRRLRLSPGVKNQQKILQAEYFDRLYRASQESIPMAILHWLRSTDFRSGEGKVSITPPPEIRYAFLDDLDLDLGFALKAFLEHGSLTLEEYREVFAASLDESFQTFEVLRTRLLLSLESTSGQAFSPAERKVEEGVRYRIPALLSQVVARHLKNRNILH